MTMIDSTQVPAPSQVSAGRTTLLPLRVDSRLILGPANAGDHLSIRALLSSLGREPLPSEFQAQLEEPFYDPSDRLVVRQGGRIVAHLRRQSRELHFGDQVLPVVWFTDLATATEFRRRGLGAAIVSEAERLAQQAGAVLALTRTAVPEMFLRRGWVPWGRACSTRAGAREILAAIVHQRREQPRVLDSVVPCQRQPGISVRLWRHVEQSALERIYQTNIARSYGPTVRSSDYWRWLISRHGYDSIYVAVAGRDRWSLDARNLVGYAVVKSERVVELLASPARPDAAEHLFSRICGDFIEQDRCEVCLDAAPDHPWHEWLVEAGGVTTAPEVEHGQVLLARLFDPARFLAGLTTELAERTGRVPWPAVRDLELRFPAFSARIAVGSQGVEVTPGATSERYLAGDSAALTQLLLGQDHGGDLLASGRLRVSDQETAELACRLFPKVSFWHPLWDDLPSASGQA